MAAATTDDMTDPTGWYMADFSSVSSGGNINFKINSGNQEISGLAGTFWYDCSSCSATNPSPVNGGVTLTVVNPAIVTKPTVTISPASGEVSLSGKITVTLTDGSGTISAALVKAGSKSYSYSDFTNNVLTINVSDVASAGNFTVTASATNEKGTTNASASLTAVEKAGVKIYVSADTAPKIWVWQESGLESTMLMGYAWANQPVMEKATGLNNDENWYVIKIPSDCYTAGKTFTFKLNSGEDIASGKATTFWYDAKGVCGAEKTFYDSDPTIKPDPVAPSVTFKPASGSTVKTTGSISVTFTNGYDTISSAKVTIDGIEYDMGTTAGTFTKTLSDLGITQDAKSITVSATVTNSVGTTTESASYTSRYVDPSKEDPFTWDNVNAYFVLTDRFYNGDKTNDHSYFRKNGLSGDENVATFHGGDLAGLTQKLDYFDKLGVNAIWITAPYEQAHGWVSGKGQKFPHYAFHGYYTLDWSSMDQNMGTVEELRTFVNACHSKGIRVIMDIVMNHVGYNNTQDMVTFKHGYTAHTDGWLEKALNPDTGKTEWYANDTVKWDNDLWDNSWFGPWIRSFGYASGSEYGGSCGGLPDVKTELTTSVGIAPVHNKKWNSVDTAEYKASYYNPS
ncbi:MAG: alpha-amylase family glycosyl hydrolase, partial [Spirochaetia bacterium]|nr:alpha-amylase family glycosyl hydrolase [Spirochaetia bacterium]